MLWETIEVLDSANENVKKFVFKKHDAIAEAVLYKYPTYKERTVMCISTMSGCTMGCTFCGAGTKFIRNLTKDEIIEQVFAMLEHVDTNTTEEIENWQIMFMSMGEPFHNYHEVKESLEDLYWLYPRARLLISTSAPDVTNYDDFTELSKEIPTIGLQFSIHESTDEARKKLIPKGNTLSLDEIATVGNMWAKATGRKPFFNYCVHENNNKDEDIEKLRKLFHPHLWEATLSVVCEKDETVSQSISRQESLTQRFARRMLEYGYSTRVFNPAGQDDIGGGCGQLWQVQKWMKEQTY